MAGKLKDHIYKLGIATTSRTTNYNPQDNGQCEQYNGVIWKTIELALNPITILIHGGSWYSQRLCTQLYLSSVHHHST